MGYLYRWVVRPVLFRFDPERVHDWATGLLPLLPEVRGGEARPAEVLRSTLFGILFTHPIGVAAGFDKTGALAHVLPRFGFSHVEVGTVTPRPQEGNAKPRLFRFPEKEALVNRMGFNNPGAERLAERLALLAPPGKRRAPVGVNMGKQRETGLGSAGDDYRRVVRSVLPVADYLVVNVSSPNTPGLRSLEDPGLLEPLLRAVREEADQEADRLSVRRPPLLVKLSPDLAAERLEGAADAAVRAGCDGLVLTNTTTDLALLGKSAPAEGGLSGKPLAERSLQAVRIARCATGGKLPIIGVGGIHNAETAYRRIRAGASLLQIYTAWIYGGPRFLFPLLRDLAAMLRRDGYRTLSEAVGTEKRR